LRDLARRVLASSRMVACMTRSFVLATLVTAFANLSSGCYADEGPPAAVAEGYAPQYYDGYVVYYDGAGRPYYYANGVVYWVPATSPFYIGLVNHWHAHGPAYGRWYAHYGYRYRGYRRR
jgi:hypothetical protein